MGLFRKKRQEIPLEQRVPQLPALPPEQEFPEETRNLEPLPSFPISNIGKTLSQTTIKEAVTRPDAELTDSKKPMTKEIEGMQLSQFMPSKEKNSFEMSDWGQPHQTRIKKTEPLFIQLDKFENTIATFNQIKLQINEIESVLRMIKDSKSKEEEKLAQWEKEIMNMKTRLEQIDQEIFSNL